MKTIRKSAERPQAGPAAEAGATRRTAVRRLAATVCVALAATFSGLVGLIPAQADEPAAATATSAGFRFDPGNIMSDEVFYDTASMTEQQIREFIDAEGDGCTGAACLKNLRVTTPDQPADKYCAAYRGGNDEDAAAVLWRISVACGVNPQVMLVTLQKESALLTRTDVTASTYDAAWGWHCPDSGPGGAANCDPAHAGFFNQGYGMAKQWTRYRLEPERYNYRAGQTVNVLWNVEQSGCGSAPVTIQNTATASLYNYTPYQPNAASLASYPGPGDACSAYGNRNFSYMFQKYFGSTAVASGRAPLSADPTVTVPADAGLPAGLAGQTITIPHHPAVAAELAGQTITAPNPAVAAGLSAGFAALGLPYVWGGGGSGAGPDNGCGRGGGDFNSCGTEIGFDCSGLTAFVLGQAGYRIPGDSGSQRAAGIPVAWDQALPGDIVGFPGHVAVYLGSFDGRPYILEASWVGTPIHVVALTRGDVDPQVHRYWTGPAAAASGHVDFSTLVRDQIAASTSNDGPSAAGVRRSSHPQATDTATTRTRAKAGTPTRRPTPAATAPAARKAPAPVATPVPPPAAILPPAQELPTSPAQPAPDAPAAAAPGADTPAPPSTTPSPEPPAGPPSTPVEPPAGPPATPTEPTGTPGTGADTPPTDPGQPSPAPDPAPGQGTEPDEGSTDVDPAADPTNTDAAEEPIPAAGESSAPASDPAPQPPDTSGPVEATASTENREIDAPNAVDPAGATPDDDPPAHEDPAVVPGRAPQEQ